MTQQFFSTSGGVAIIGAGPGGSSAAYYLAQVSPSTPITLYEQSGYVGGRCTTVDVLGETIELGASIFVDVNSNLVEAAKRLNLSYVRDDDLDGTLGIWDGREFVYKDMGGSSYWNLAKLVWRYGLSPYRAQKHVKAVLGSFLKVYGAVPFASLSEVSTFLGLAEYTNTTGLQSFTQAGVSDQFANHVLNAATRVNYAQDLDSLHGLMSAVSFLIDDARAIVGGNRRIFEGMISESAATVHLNTTIASISKVDAGWSVCDVSQHCNDFQDVIIAAPFAASQIVVTPAVEMLPVEYITLHVTLLATNKSLSNSPFFGQTNVPESVLTTRDWDSKQLPFQSISIVGRAKDGTNIYKVFSMNRMTNDALTEIFGQDISSDWTYRKIWQSYPVGRPTVQFDDWEVADGLWYLNGMERFISTMETATLASRNVVSLIAQKRHKIGSLA